MAVIDLLASDWSPGGQCGYIVPGVPWYNVPCLPGQTGYIVPGHPGTMRGVLVLIAPTVEGSNYLEIIMAALGAVGALGALNVGDAGKIQKHNEDSFKKLLSVLEKGNGKITLEAENAIN